jgi:Zn-dependent alcohol dehydrogenase
MKPHIFASPYVRPFQRRFLAKVFQFLKRAVEDGSLGQAPSWSRRMRGMGEGKHNSSHPPQTKHAEQTRADNWGNTECIPDRYADDKDILRSLLPLTDVMATGHHAAVSADLKAVGQARELTFGGGNHVLECVGASSSLVMAARIVRPGGAIGYVGVPRIEKADFLAPLFFKNATFRGGPAPVRQYIEELMQDVLQGTLDPAAVLDMTVDLDGVPEGCQAMDDREAVKVMVKI